MPKYYAGIGSRETPIPILNKMQLIATKLESLGYVLRSGGAGGADKAFAEGCSNKEIYPPWDGFNGIRKVFEIPEQAYVIAEGIHPGWQYLSPAAKSMMARNAMQILGPNLDTPSSFVVCWTKDGCFTKATRTNKTGGTGQAIAHADMLGIPVFNLANNAHYLRIHQFINGQNS
jgi:hypothetical protein